eukprot:scaffold17503_cov62-Attheya_sp.AAC.4
MFDMIIQAHRALLRADEIAQATQNPIDLRNFHPAIHLAMATCLARPPHPTLIFREIELR